MIAFLKFFIKGQTKKLSIFVLSLTVLSIIALSAAFAVPDLTKLNEKITDIKSNITVALEEIDEVKAVAKIRYEKATKPSSDEGLLLEEPSLIEETEILEEELPLSEETLEASQLEESEELLETQDEEAAITEDNEAVETQIQSEPETQFQTEPQTEITTASTTKPETEPETEPETKKPVPQTEVTDPTTVIQREIMSKVEKQVLELVNHERALNGIKPLILSESLQKSAQIRVREIFVKFSHTRPNGEDCYTAFPEGYNWKGENIAMGHKNPEQVVSAWMNSEGHRANILNPKFTHIGIGALCIDEKCGWVQCFGESK